MATQNPIAAWVEHFERSVSQRKALARALLEYAGRLFGRGLPPVYELHHLSILVGISERFIVRMSLQPSDFYRTFKLKKRRGGFRTIAVPKPSLLHVQHWILENILSTAPPHPASHGFVKGRGVLSNAIEHQTAREILKMDLKSFFGSISQKRVISVFRIFGYSPRVSYFLSTFCCLEGSLPQGAATSPSLSNLIAKRLDLRLSALAAKLELKYTRYADDITLSGRSIPIKVIGYVSGIAHDEGFEINPSKTKILRQGAQKIITGVSVSSGSPKLPRTTVRSIKQDAHFLLKFGLLSHASHTGKWDPLAKERLLGRIAFWRQIDPSNEKAIVLFESVKAFNP